MSRFSVVPSVIICSVYINRSGPGKVCAATKYTRPRQTISGVLAEGGGIVMGTTLTDGSLTHG